MKKFEILEELLRKHKINKARLSFLENHLKQFTPEKHNDYIEYKMFSPGYSGRVPQYIMEHREEIARLNKVEETAAEYREKCDREYKDAKASLEKEVKELKYYVFMMEDGLATLDKIHEKYRIILERYYINGCRMEDVADVLHISRSRCYELSKEAIRWMARIVYGDCAAGGQTP